MPRYLLILWTLPQGRRQRGEVKNRSPLDFLKQDEKTMTEENQQGKHKSSTLFRGLAVIVMLVVTALFVTMLVTGDKYDFAFALTVMFWSPVVLVSLVILIFNIVLLCKPQIRDTFNLVIVLLGLLNILLLVGVCIHDNYLSKQVDSEHLVSHYQTHEAEIWDLAEYTRAAMDSGAWMRLEFDGKKIEMFHTQPVGDTVSNNWREYGGPSLPASIGSRIGVTPDEIEHIREKMKTAGCISIELTNYGTATSANHYGEKRHEFDHIIIGRKRFAMSAYYYVLFRQPMTDSTWNYLLEDDCTRIPICDTMALEYGSPAFGDICYPRKNEILKQLNLKKR